MTPVVMNVVLLLLLQEGFGVGIGRRSAVKRPRELSHAGGDNFGRSPDPRRHFAQRIAVGFANVQMSALSRNALDHSQGLDAFLQNEAAVALPRQLDQVHIFLHDTKSKHVGISDHMCIKMYSQRKKSLH